MGVTNDLPDPPVTQGKTYDRKGVVFIPFGNINRDVFIKPIVPADDIGKATESLENGIPILSDKHLVKLLRRIGGGAIRGVLRETPASGNQKEKPKKKGGSCQNHRPVIIQGSAASASFSLTPWFGILSGKHGKALFVDIFPRQLGPYAPCRNPTRGSFVFGGSRTNERGGR